MFNEITIRKTPSIMFFRLILAQVSIALIALILGILRSFLDIPTDSEWMMIDSPIFRYSLIAVLEIGMAFGIFTSWFREYYILSPSTLTYFKGTFTVSKLIVELNPKEVDLEEKYGLFGKIFGYRTLLLHIQNRAEPFEISYVSASTVSSLQEALKSEKSKAEYENLVKLKFKDLLEYEENSQLEFKSSLRWDYEEGKFNKELEKASIKNMAAFANSDGGILSIGVSDDHQVIGLQKDFKTLKKQDADGYEAYLNQLLLKHFGGDNRQLFKIRFELHKGKQVCNIYVKPSEIPIFSSFNGKQEFYIRTGNSTVSLDVREIIGYYQNRFNGK